MQTNVRYVPRLSSGGFDPKSSTRENVDRYNAYRRTSGGGGSGKGGFALVLIIVLVLLAFLNMCVSNR